MIIMLLRKFLLIIISLSPKEKNNSTDPCAAPFLNNNSAGRSGREVPNKANSTARSIDDFPQPISPESTVDPSGKLMTESVYERIFCSFNCCRSIWIWFYGDLKGLLWLRQSFSLSFSLSV